MNRTPRYYESLGRSCDFLLRCRDCRRLLLYSTITATGACPKCGNRKVVEVTGLSLWEWLKIRLGILDFPDRRIFLKEFSPWQTKGK